MSHNTNTMIMKIEWKWISRYDDVADQFYLPRWWRCASESGSVQTNEWQKKKIAKWFLFFFFCCATVGKSLRRSNKLQLILIGRSAVKQSGFCQAARLRPTRCDHITLTKFGLSSQANGGICSRSYALHLSHRAPPATGSAAHIQWETFHFISKSRKSNFIRLVQIDLYVSSLSTGWFSTFFSCVETTMMKRLSTLPSRVVIEEHH